MNDVENSAFEYWWKNKATYLSGKELAKAAWAQGREFPIIYNDDEYGECILDANTDKEHAASIIAFSKREKPSDDLISKTVLVEKGHCIDLAENALRNMRRWAYTAAMQVKMEECQIWYEKGQQSILKK